MICLIQRACHGKVEICGNTVGEIGYGMVVLVGFERHDTPTTLDKMAHKLLHYRVFADDQDRMNLNIQQINGEILLVPQFTLAAETRKGLRPNFTPAAAPETAAEYFKAFTDQIRAIWPKVACGKFGANMQVTLCNDGPVTFWLQL